jgi:hypothetical protein
MISPLIKLSRYHQLKTTSLFYFFVLLLCFEEELDKEGKVG